MANSFVQFLEYHYATNKAFMVSLMILTPIQIAFWILSFIYVDDDAKPEVWNWATKLVPVSCNIISSAILVYKEPKNKLRIFVMVALILSVIADALLIPDNLFLFGLVAFAIAHLFYIVAFSIPPNPNLPKVRLNLLYIIPYVCIFVCIPTPIVVHLIKTDGSVAYCVALYIYAAILSTMGWRATARLGYAYDSDLYKESRTSQIIAIVASFIFMASDSMLAYNAFYLKFTHSHIAVLLTYWLAQFLFMFSLLRSPVPEDETATELKNVQFI